jgi:polyhydroxyalkanoate synthase
VGSKDTQDICLQTGHIGIYVSSKFQKEFAPKIAGWLKEREHEEPQRQAKKRSSRQKPAKKKVSKTGSVPVPQ